VNSEKANYITNQDDCDESLIDENYVIVLDTQLDHTRLSYNDVYGESGMYKLTFKTNVVCSNGRLAEHMEKKTAYMKKKQFMTDEEILNQEKPKKPHVGNGFDFNPMKD
jgi:hypothetical protein